MHIFTAKGIEKGFQLKIYISGGHIDVIEWWGCTSLKGILNYIVTVVRHNTNGLYLQTRSRSEHVEFGVGLC